MRIVTYGTLFDTRTRPPQVPLAPAGDYSIYLPAIGGGSVQPEPPPEPGPEGSPGEIFPAGMNAEAWALAELWMNHPEQRRQDMRPHPELVKAARYRAQTMMAENHFAHVSLRGETANEVVNRYYPLPWWYPAAANSVESLGHGYSSAQDVMHAIENATTAHRDHVLGLHPGWQAQNRIGVWCEQGDRDIYGHVPTYSRTWVMISVPG